MPNRTIDPVKVSAQRKVAGKTVTYERLSYKGNARGIRAMKRQEAEARNKLTPRSRRREFRLTGMFIPTSAFDDPYGFDSLLEDTDYEY